MSNPQSANIQKIVGTATAVVGGIALLTKLGIDEVQHRSMKAKTNPSNAYSSIRILPDLVRFEGYIRIHRHRGDIVCPVPRKKEEEPKEEEKKNDGEDPKIPESQTQVSNSDNMEDNDMNDMNDVDDMIIADNDNNNNNNNNNNDNDNDIDIKWLDSSNISNEDTPKESGWFNSLSRFASSAKKSFTKLQTMYESQTIEFDSDFPFILRDSAIHKTEIESYIVENNKFLDLFEPILSTDIGIKTPKDNDKLPLNEMWEFCAVKIHHETLYIRYAKKWITLPLNTINISPLTLNDSDCTAFIVDYQKYFTISEDKGYVLLCEHLNDPFIEIQQQNTATVPIDIPNDHTMCPWPYVQQYLIGYHNTNYVSLRKEQVLKAIVEMVSNAMKDDGFDNHTSYDHAIQFRKCIDTIISKIDGAEKALQFKKQMQSKKNNNDDDDNDDDDVDMSSKQEMDADADDDDDDDDGKESSDDHDNDKNMVNVEGIKEEKKEEILKEESLPYLNLLNDRYHGLNIHELSELDWKLTSEASWLANYVYDMHSPQYPEQDGLKRRDSWSQQFTSYMKQSNINIDIDQEAMDDNNDNNNNNMNVIEEDKYEYCGPPHLATDILWKEHSNKHSENLSKYGFELLDYAITQNGQSVQWMITRSYDNPNTIFLTFKGTSNPLDAMVNIGLHPLELPHFQCSVFSGMYAALQQSLPFICRRLNIYSSDQYFQHNPCPPNKNITKIYKLIINGHSLGGGYAQLFLAHLLSAPEFEDYFETIKCITFGTPLVFCKDVRNSFFYKKLNDKCLNFLYQFDLVPRLQNGMEAEYRNKLLQGLLMSQLPVSNIGMVFDINQRLNYVLNKFQHHQWLLDRYCCIGKYIVLFEKDEPRSIDTKNKCFTKSAKSYHLAIDANKVLTVSSLLPHNQQIYAVQVLKDHKMLNYMKTIMFQQF